jgi:YHS domain-containing protein
MARIIAYLFNLVFVVIVGWILSRVFRGIFGSPGGRMHSSRSGAVGGADQRAVHGKMARDPVCGMFVSTEVSHQLTRGNETLHFCSRECLERYQANVGQS